MLGALFGTAASGGGTSTSTDSGASGRLENRTDIAITQGNITFGKKETDWTMLAVIAVAALFVLRKGR